MLPTVVTKKLSRQDAKHAKIQRCHFDPFGQAQGKLREKSFLDPSHSLGMTGRGPSPWRPLRRCSGHALRLCARHVFSDFFFIPKFQISLARSFLETQNSALFESYVIALDQCQEI